MGTITDDTAAVTRALSGDLVIDMGQLSRRAIFCLDKLTKAGTLVRLRASSCGVTGYSAAWVHANRISEGCTRGYFDGHYFEIDEAFHAMEAA